VADAGGHGPQGKVQEPRGIGFGGGPQVPFGPGGGAHKQPRPAAGLAVALLAAPQPSDSGEQPERQQAAHG